MSDSEFHYVRTTGVDGGVDAVDGRAIGVDLESVLKVGLPPFKVALEIISSLCEILDIADQDGEIHGDITPKNIFLDDTGAVSVEGFGKDRVKGISPDAKPTTASDLYGLGYTAFRLLSPRDLKDLPKVGDAHDDAVIDAVVALPWGDMNEAWVGDIQWFLAKLMSFNPEERPQAVEAWRTFVAFADEAEGANLAKWSVDAIEGGGERRDVAKAVRPAAEPEEDLGGPVMKSGALAKGAISFGSGGPAKGGATAFWSKDQMKAALESDEEEDEKAEEKPAFKPKAGGGASTSFWSRDQMEAMARGDASAPRPQRKGGAEPATPKPAAPAPKPAAPPPAAPKAATPTPAPKAAPPPMAKPGAPPAPPPPIAAPPPMAAPPPLAPPPAGFAGGPVAASGPSMSPPPSAVEDDEPKQGGSMTMIIVGVVVVVLLLLCGGIAVVGGGAAFFMGGSDSTASSTSTDNDKTDADEKEKEKPKEKQDTGGKDEGATPPPKDDPKPEPKPEPKPAPKPEPKPAPKPEPKPTTNRTTTTTPTTTPTTRPTTNRTGGATTPAAGGPTRVVFTVPGSGSMKCGDGTNEDMTDKGSVTFKEVPSDGITCTFYEGRKPVCAGFISPGNRKCSCDAGSGDLKCD